MIEEVITKICNRFKKKDTSLYAIQTGVFAGEFWVYVKQDQTKYYFLATPTMLNRDIQKEVFESGKKANIVDFVESLPSKIHEVCVKQFEKNTK